MGITILERFTAWFGNVTFRRVSNIVHPGELKWLMDPFFVVIEKFAYLFPILRKMYFNMYEDMVDGELEMLDISASDRVAIVGSGSLPVTSMLIAKKSDSQVVGIDLDPVAIRKAEELVAHEGIRNLSFILDDGLSHPFNDFDAVFLLYGIRKQKDMLSYMSISMDEDMKIILRATENEQGLVNIDDEVMDLSELFLVKDHRFSICLGPMDSYLLLKKR